jgi:hypothetical protein
MRQRRIPFTHSSTTSASTRFDAIREPNHGVLQWVKGHW